MKPLSVTDHAVLRYLERVNGLDLDKIRTAIREVVEPAARIGASKFTKDGLVYTLRHHEGTTAVTTIYPDDHDKKIPPPHGNGKRDEWSKSRRELGAIKARISKGVRRP